MEKVWQFDKGSWLGRMHLLADGSREESQHIVFIGTMLRGI